MKYLVDTQVVSGARKNAIDELPDGDWTVPSVVLQELFLMQEGESGYVYGIPRIHRYAASGPMRTPAEWRDHARRRPVPTSADRITLDFNRDYPSRVEIGHSTVAAVLDYRARPVLQGCCSVLAKQRQRIILAEYDHLVARQARATPLTPTIAQVGLTLLQTFLATGRTPKKNIRNTLNDLFVLAHSLHSQLHLVSDDLLLGEFGTEIGCSVAKSGSYWTIVPPPDTATSRRLSKESKCYINTLWRATVAGSRARQ